MAFEVVYHYYERNEDGDYDRDNTKSIQRLVGSDPLEDVPLEKLAVEIMKQLARRDVWVVDADIHELSKKKINFKEVKGGILIKNKKFALDKELNFEVQAEDVEPAIPGVPPQAPQAIPAAPQAMEPVVQVVEQAPPPTPVPAPQAAPVQNKSPLTMTNSTRVLFHMEFAPELPDLAEVAKKRLRFTEGKRYPVYKREDGGALGQIITVEDDTGKRIMLSDKYFLPPQRGLVGEDEVGGFDTLDTQGGNIVGATPQKPRLLHHSGGGGGGDGDWGPDGAMPDLTKLRGRV